MDDDNTMTDDSHSFYDVRFYSDNIHTLVTHNPQQLALWISGIEAIHRIEAMHSKTWWSPRLIVGLDVQWRPKFNHNQIQENPNPNPVATIQLCVERRCVVFQVLKYCSVFATAEVPIELKQFLGNKAYTFIGVDIFNDVAKLKRDYRVIVEGQIVDLSNLAAAAYNKDWLKIAGLKILAIVVLGREYPMTVDNLQSWDNSCLTPEQVMHACIDAFVSFEIGNMLLGNVAAIGNIAVDQSPEAASAVTFLDQSPEAAVTFVDQSPEAASAVTFIDQSPEAAVTFVDQSVEALTSSIMNMVV